MANTSELKYRIPVGSKSNDIDRDKTDAIESEHVLIDAAAVGNFEKVQELLESGVSAEAEEFNKFLFYASKNYVIPLQIAAVNGHEKCVQILIDHGADVNAKDHFGITALHMAAEQGHYFCIKALLKAGADCCVPTKFSKCTHYTAVPYLVGTTPLHLAAANNHINCVRKLIQYGADYNAVDERGHTSLYIAAQAGFDACVLVHLKNAVTREILSIPSFDTSDTPLHFTVNYNMVDCVKELLYLGSDVHHCNHFGNSPLDLALIPTTENRATKMEILKLLVLKGYNTDINCRDAHGFTPLHYVSFDGYHSHFCRRPEMAKFLIAYGADVNIKNTYGYSLLECELKSCDKNFEILRFLVKCMLYLPRLETLRVDTHKDHSVPIEFRNVNNEIENAFFNRIYFPNLPEFVLAGRNQNFEMNSFLARTRPAFLNIQMSHHHLHQRLRQRVRYPARQPHLMHVCDAFRRIHNERNFAENENVREGNLSVESSYIIKKQLWYEQIASNPRTLQHNCRYVIRSFMGASKLKYIRRLPIAPSLQSYLLLENDE